MKSDSLIVLVKPPNKVGRPAADAAPGIDGLRWEQYEAQLDQNIVELHTRLHQGVYRAKPSRRAYVPKSDGRQRPLGIAALEDKIVQRGVARLLNAIYETDFLSYFDELDHEWGYFTYQAIPGNWKALGTFRTQVTRMCYKSLRRRS